MIDLLRRGDGRLVRSDADLLDVTLKQLDRLQRDIRDDGAFHELWNDPSGHSPSPKTEDDISDWIRRRLNDRLNDGMIVDREVQVARPRGHGIGTRIDLILTSATTSTAPLARVLVEAKRIDNAELLAAMNDQLAAALPPTDGVEVRHLPRLLDHARPTASRLEPRPVAEHVRPEVATYRSS